MVPKSRFGFSLIIVANRTGNIISAGKNMKYVFANHPTGRQILRIGDDMLEINEGKAEVDELNPAQVTLAEVYGGKPESTARVVNEKQQPNPLTGRHQTFVKTIIEQKGIFIAALRILNNQLRGVRLGNGSK